MPEITKGGGGAGGGEPAITPGTTAQYWRGDKTWQALTKTAVGLPNVDNTADLSKPISTAQQAALDSISKHLPVRQDNIVFGDKIDVHSFRGPAATVPLTIPTYDGSGESTHPSVLYFRDGWGTGGYNYWMAFTPYPTGNDDYENPSILASYDGDTWVVPAGLTNPLDNASGVPYNSDTELVMDPDGVTMHCVWRYYDNPGTEYMYKRSSTDGVTWSAKALVYSVADTVRRVMSPTLVWENSQWVMWGVDILPSPNTLVRMTSTSLTGTWSAPTVCTLTGVQNGKEPWHVQIRKVGSQYVGLLNDCELDQNGLNGDLQLMTSTDGLAWTLGPTCIPRKSGDVHASLYRSSFVVAERNGVLGLDVWYPGWTTSPTVWRMFRTHLSQGGTNGNQFERLMIQVRAGGGALHGGGQRYAAAATVSWSYRMMLMGIGRNPSLTPQGYLAITMPADGTVIPKFGHPTVFSGTVSGGQIPLGGWEALYYAPPWGSATGNSVDANFRTVYYTSDFIVPDDWILICVRNGDPGDGSVTWADGRQSDYWRAVTFSNSWVNYGGTFFSAAYRKVEGVVQFRGVIKTGTVGLPAFTLPAGYRPNFTVVLSTVSNAAAGRVDVTNTGTVVPMAPSSNVYVSLDGLTFNAES